MFHRADQTQQSNDRRPPSALDNKRYIPRDNFGPERQLAGLYTVRCTTSTVFQPVWKLGLGIRARAIGFRPTSARVQLAATHSALPFLHNVDPDFLSPLLHYWDDTPYIPVKLDGSLLPFLFDTGAAVSVLPLLVKPLSAYSCPETEERRRTYMVSFAYDTIVLLATELACKCLLFYFSEPWTLGLEHSFTGLYCILRYHLMIIIVIIASLVSLTTLTCRPLLTLLAYIVHFL